MCALLWCTDTHACACVVCVCVQLPLMSTFDFVESLLDVTLLYHAIYPNHINPTPYFMLIHCVHICRRTHTHTNSSVTNKQKTIANNSITLQFSSPHDDNSNSLDLKNLFLPVCNLRPSFWKIFPQLNFQCVPTQTQTHMHGCSLSLSLSLPLHKHWPNT